MTEASSPAGASIPTESLARRFLVREDCDASAPYVVYALGDAGHGAAGWHGVTQALDPVIALRAVRLPGRENRLAEAPCETLAAQVDDLAAGMFPLIAADRRPYHVVGVCSGAATALEAVRRIEASGLPGPESLIVVGQLAPQAVRPSAFGRGELGRNELGSWLLGRGRLPPGPFGERLLDLMIPALRADVRAFEYHDHTALPAVRCDVVAVHGTDDEISAEDAAAWAAVTSGATRVFALPGGHHLLESAPRELARLLESLCPGDARAGQAVFS
ncbi:thioesterase II family protein [Streptomyces guryensis]|uniref:Alpha/beta fold hydrolase n=1 Tax=Streptomyces guryensis TaxID=2886947 RepID=A0A9Q3VUW2_9ACTN|nr:alpha/beta fold hydrolase [Streptomyces guryensis]MCD9878896.1 alpha/beta fold hydrolase [Streptomyces guryensis]